MTKSHEFRVPVGLLSLAAPPSGTPKAGDSYFDTTIGYIQTWNGTAWVTAGGISQTVSDTRYVLKAGDTVTGLLQVNTGYTAAFVLDRGPEASNYANFEYRTSGVQKWVLGTRAGEAENFTFYNASTDQRALQIDGLSSLVKVIGDPLDPLGVATKQYVDAAGAAQVEEVIVSATAPTGPPTELWLDTASPSEAAGSVAKTGDTMTGELILPGDPTVALSAAPKQYVDSKIGASSGSVAKTGDTMTGELILPGDPTVALSAAPKQYVDSMVTVSTVPPTGTPARDGLIWIVVE
jgi:hypothetical protein